MPRAAILTIAMQVVHVLDARVGTLGCLRLISVESLAGEPGLATVLGSVPNVDMMGQGMRPVT